ncbi:MULTISPECIES: SPJ_0845 family protein [unclassified Enterococcus]|nr:MULTISPECIES: SPJ_0845 family protein [unclassified Enterococcus]
MGLKFERVDDLDRLFESFAVDPKKKEKPQEELAEKKEDQKETEQ